MKELDKKEYIVAYGPWLGTFTHSYWDSEDEAMAEAHRLEKLRDDGDIKALRKECPSVRGDKYYFQVLKFDNWNPEL